MRARIRGVVKIFLCRGSCIPSRMDRTTGIMARTTTVLEKNNDSPKETIRIVVINAAILGRERLIIWEINP
jgi:hypothetical protein